MDIIFQLEPIEVFYNVSQEVVSSLYFESSEINTLVETNVYEKAKYDLRKIISDSDFEIQKLIKIVNSKGWDQKKVSYFVTKLEESWSIVIGAALNHYSSNYGETITNFDWLAKLIIGNSELKALKYPLLQLLVTTLNKVGQHNNISYDINKDMLLKIIYVLENIS